MNVVWEHKRNDFAYVTTALCGACVLPVSFLVADPGGRGYNPLKFSGNIEDQGFDVKQQWPRRVDLKAPQHVPHAVAKRFLEGEAAYDRHSWNAAVAMYRSALDIATKGLDGVPAGKTFYRRLEWLHDNHRITPDMRSWADKVRVEGNDALHEPDDYTERDAKPLRLFTETFLRYMFELPGEVDAFRRDVEELGDGEGVT